MASLIASVALAAPIEEPPPIPYVPMLQPEVHMEIQKMVPYSDIKNDEYGGQCVEWIKKYLNMYGTSFAGNAVDIIPNSYAPSIGSAVLTIEPIGHAALIIGIEGSEIIVAESNYNGDELIDVGRRINMYDSRIRGYFVF